jgi:phosphatidylserine/phosphatidylglycerophosphate/cardiolipin synthase-like enzyme
MDWLVFTPAARRAAVLQLMRSAGRTLMLSVFRCDDLTIVDELAAAVARGVRVRILITRRARGWKRKLTRLTALLQSTGAEVLRYKNPAMKYHAKYVIADDGPALVTSLNFTTKCFETTCDFLVFTDDADIVSGLKRLFEADCADGAAFPDGLTERLIVGPEQSRPRLRRLFAEAGSSIRIIDHRVTDPEILAILAEKQRQGVAVQVARHGRISGLLCHGRMILIDEKTAIIGSTHLSRPSLDLRREVAIVTKESGLVTELSDFFQSLAIDDYDLTDWPTVPATSPADEDDDEDE